MAYGGEGEIDGRIKGDTKVVNPGYWVTGFPIAETGQLGRGSLKG